jgi:hypothetical protein
MCCVFFERGVLFRVIWVFMCCVVFCALWHGDISRTQEGEVGTRGLVRNWKLGRLSACSVNYRVWEIELDCKLPSSIVSGGSVE